MNKDRSVSYNEDDSLQVKIGKRSKEEKISSVDKSNYGRSQLPSQIGLFPENSDDDEENKFSVDTSKEGDWVSINKMMKELGDKKKFQPMKEIDFPDQEDFEFEEFIK